MIVLLFKVLDMLIFDFGVAETYCLEAIEGLGMPPPEILTEAVFTLFLLLGGGLIVELLLDDVMLLTRLAS